MVYRELLQQTGAISTPKQKHQQSPGNLCVASGESLVISHLRADFAQPRKPQRTDEITTLVTWLVTPPVPAALEQQGTQVASNTNMNNVALAHPVLPIKATKDVN